MSVAEAWRLLADTDHLNRSIGLPAIQFSPMDGARGKVIRDARARAFGFIPVRWKEYPFEWVRERRYIIRREFASGPIAVLEGGVEMDPAEDGVRVKVYADFTPANFTGTVLWRLGSGTVDSMVKFCDRYLSRKAEGLRDPTPGPPQRPRLDRAQLESLLEKLRGAPVRGELVTLLEEALVEASDDRVYRIRPYALADAWNADRFEVLRLFMHAARLGLFELRWDLLCPNCRVPKAESKTLRDLPQRYHCDTCGIDYATEFDERVELRFSVHPSVRRVDGDVYCIGGPLRTPHILAQQYLRANESRRLEVGVRKPLRLRAVGGSRHLELVPNADSRWSSDVSVIYADGRWTGPHSLMLEGDALSVPTQASLNVRNQTGGPLLAVVEDTEWTDQATTAAEVTALAEFQRLFKSEMLAPGQEITVKEVALVASRLSREGSLFAASSAAEEKTRRALHEELVGECVATCHGGVVRVVGDTVTSGFYRVGQAVAAAIALQEAVAAWSARRHIEPPLRLAIGVHVGPVTALNGEERLEYFGRTVDRAGQLAAEADPGDIVMLAADLDPEKGSLSNHPEALVSESFAATRAVGLANEALVRLRMRGTTPAVQSSHRS
jgi:hypothetical protein